MVSNWQTLDLPSQHTGRPIALAVVGDVELGEQLTEAGGRAGFSMLVSHDVSAALDVLRAEPTSVVILDVDSSWGCLSKTFEQIREISPKSTLVLLIGCWDVRATEIPKSCHHFLYKPIRPKEVEDLLVSLTESFGNGHLSA